jgi:AraC-like DNA-binding protein
MHKGHVWFFFAVQEGDFGRIEVVKHHHDLVMHAHPYTQVADVVGLSRSRFFELFHDRLGKACTRE